MPKVLEFTPPWLRRPSEGYDLFAIDNIALKQGNSGDAGIPNGKTNETQEYLGATRTIARRGTEVFVVVENKIRWSDLCMLQEAYKAGLSPTVEPNSSGKKGTSSNLQSSGQKYYRVSRRTLVADAC